MRNQPFCNTTQIRAEVKKLNEVAAKRWRGFHGNAEQFTMLQEAIKPEKDYLAGLWDGQMVNDKKFAAWNCMSAYYDTPKDRYSRCLHGAENKYDVLHDREDYLEGLWVAIWTLYHDWQFTTQGWTAI